MKESITGSKPYVIFPNMIGALSEHSKRNKHRQVGTDPSSLRLLIPRSGDTERPPLALQQHTQ